MKNFLEFLAQKDPNLLQEYIELTSLSEKSWHKYLLPLMLGAQATAQAGTPTELKQRQDYNQNLKNPQDSKTEKELYNRMFTQGITVDDLNRNTKNKIFNAKINDPDEDIGFDKFKKINDKIDAAKLPHHFRPGIALHHIDDEYAPEEILFRKIVNSYEIIKSNVPDPEKFQKDYNNLKSNPNDIGFAMNKDALMNNRVLLVIVTDQAMRRVQPGANGYAHKLPPVDGPIRYTNEPRDTDISTIVLPERAVKEIKNGEITLTDKGKKTYRHEARHNAQLGHPGQRHQGTMSKSEKEYFKHYMNDPKEIGVRLGELKNNLSTKILLKLTKDTTHYNNINQLLKDVEGNEKELLKLFMTPSGQYQNTIKYIKEKFAKSSSDMGSLFNHYDELSDKEKSILMQELLDNYDNVVKNDTKTPNTNPIT
jgi:hypothetical protein